jgi:hypothetical protein
LPIGFFIYKRNESGFLAGIVAYMDGAFYIGNHILQLHPLNLEISFIHPESFFEGMG